MSRPVVVQGPRHPSFLVISLLEADALSDKQVIAISRLRWGVELFYRRFKPSFGRRKLRSHGEANAEAKATWLWPLARHGRVELSCDGIAAASESGSGLPRAYRGLMQQYRSRPEPGEPLTRRLSVAVIDGPQRSNKTSRDYPQKKREPAPGEKREPAPGVARIRSTTPFAIGSIRRSRNNHSKRLSA